MSETDEPGPDQRLRLSPERVMWREVNGEIIALALPSSQYLTVNVSATELWQLLADGASPRELARSLATRWEIPPEQAERDVSEFLSELSDADVLEDAGPAQEAPE